MTYVPAKEQIR